MPSWCSVPRMCWINRQSPVCGARGLDARRRVCSRQANLRISLARSCRRNVTRCCRASLSPEWCGPAPCPVNLSAVHPVLSSGNQPLIGLVGSRPDDGILFNVDLDKTNLLRAPDWPILISNIVELRRQDLPGPERWNYRAGEWIRVRLGRDPKGPLHFRCGSIERDLPPARLMEFTAPAPCGLLQITEGKDVLFQLGVNFLDEKESDLSDRATRRIWETQPASRWNARGKRSGNGSALLDVARDCRSRRARQLVLGLKGREPMNNVYLLFPELLLLLVPLLFLLFWRGRASGLNGIVRVLLLLIVALIAAVPLAPLGGQGVDVVVVADLSRSMPEGSRQRQMEIVQLLEGRRAKGDRVGIVTYGRDARIERLPEELGNASAFVQQVDPDGSNLGDAIALAASLIPRERPGRLIVLVRW